MKRKSSYRRKPYTPPEPNSKKRTKFFPGSTEWNLEDKLLANFRLTVLRLCGWRRSYAAEVLGVSYRALVIQLKEYQRRGFIIEPPPNVWNDLPLLTGEELSLIDEIVDMKRISG